MDSPNKQTPSQMGVAEGSGRNAYDQLCRLFASPLFSRSKRYRDFLQFVVEETLHGRSDGLKERTIGIEVFGRKADYDTNADPIVRVAAAEIRKRIAQYYFEESHAHELRIEFHPGSYVPAFRMPDVSSSSSTEAGMLAPAPESVHEPFREAAIGPLLSADRVWWKSWSARASMVVVFTSLLACSAFFYRPNPPQRLVDQFWSPFAQSHGSVVICPGVISESDPHSGVLPSDVSALTGIESSLRNIKMEYHVVSYPSAEIAEFRSGPDVFIGPWHNKWVLKLTGPLRFNFGNSDRKSAWIQDEWSSGKKRWQNNQSGPKADGTTYAILARFWDPGLGRPVVIVAGLSPQGTIAAEDVLNQPKYLRSLVRGAPGNWQDMNLEVVIGTHVANGNPGPPTVEASYFWE